MTVKPLNVDSTTGFNFDADNQIGIIAPGIVDFDWGSHAVFSNGFANNRLVNKGTVISAASNFSAVFLNNGSASIVNYAGAEIIGASDAIDLDGTGMAVVNNKGKIIGATGAGVGFDTNPGGELLVNHGYISGAGDGVLNFSTVAGGAIHNFNTIRSDGYAIFVDTAVGLRTSITNAAGALIESSSDRAVGGFGGSFRLVNHGTVIGGITDNDGANDVIINRGRIDGVIELGSGNDIFNGAGGTSGTIFVHSGHE
jgi:hypothetical protein